ncbi:MAG TPA: prephenate dehydrogenase/arogenate dehydrogenase family protein [Gemmataceae bacterium]|nr:prephenate dehydrogenase/arogenate dehydrogenase family protein [Gemmataceae bacterium]
MKFHTLTIVGVGLIGGSIGLAAGRRGLAQRIVGVGRNQSSLDRALAVGAIDEASLDVLAAVDQTEVVVFCTPVDRIAAQVLAAARKCRPGTLLTDAGGAKATIVSAVEAGLPEHVQFVGSHPLAGSEKRGPEFADADLFQGRLTVLTPTARTDSSALERTKAFWRALGSRVKVMSPDEHDRALAVTSHLPHVTAAALAGILPPALHELTATGLRDTTRIAAGDPALWTGILLQNRAAMLEAIVTLQAQLSEFARALEATDRDALDVLLARAKRTRDALGS